MRLLVLLLLLPTVAATHADGIQWACGFGGGGGQGHPDDCGIDPIGGDDVGSVGEPLWGSSWVDDEERIIGVVIDGAAHAVPVKMLDRHEIVNTEVAGVPVAITYCPLCGSGVTFDRRVDGQVLDFAASGFLYEHDLVMWDPQTNTLWTQILGAPIGTLVDRSVQSTHHDTLLDTIPTALMPWGDWVAQHPNSVMLRPVDGHQYGGAYRGYADSCRIGISGASECDIRGLHPKEEVMGVREGPVAFPRYAMVNAGGIAFDPVTGTVAVWPIDGAPMAFAAGDRTFNQTDDGWIDQDGRLWDLALGMRADGGDTLEPLEAYTMYWFAWETHLSDTHLWLPEDTPAPSEQARPKDLEDNGKLPGFTIGIVAVFLIAAAYFLRKG